MRMRAPATARELVRPQWAVSIAAALALIGFVGAAQWNSSLAREEFISSAQRVLVTRAEQLQRDQERLLQEVREAEAELAALQERATGSESELLRLTRDLRAARIAAGVEEMRGPGVVIEIADSLRAVRPGENRANYIVLADDLRDIVAALWASGAEAISISGSLAPDAPGVRLAPTSAIYGAGAAILVNTSLLSPPYRIVAIGPEGLHDRFLADPAFLGRVERRIEAYELQFAAAPQDEVFVPAFVGTRAMQWGAPVTDPEP